MVLAGTGVALLLTGMPGRWVLAPPLIVIGLLLKGAALILTDDPDGGAAKRGERRPVTLGGDVVERPRAGIPTGRAALSIARSHHAQGASPVPVPGMGSVAAEEQRRAS